MVGPVSEQKSWIVGYIIFPNFELCNEYMGFDIQGIFLLYRVD